MTNNIYYLIHLMNNIFPKHPGMTSGVATADRGGQGLRQELPYKVSKMKSFFTKLIKSELLFNLPAIGSTH